jgi:hypothetical protein
MTLDPRKLQLHVSYGFNRTYNFRMARLMFMRAFLGQYYDKSHGNVGRAPMNLIFNAIRTLLPQIVMSNPKYNISSEFTEYDEYAELLALGINFNSKRLNMAKKYRLWMVDTILGGLGVMKTGLCTGEEVIAFEAENNVDPGMIYSDHVDFDNFVFDPAHNGQIEEAPWMGDRVRVKRQLLLDSGLYNNDLIMKLPNANRGVGGQTDRASDLSAHNVRTRDLYQQDVELVELYVPDQKTIITVPAPIGNGAGPIFDEYLREADAYVPNGGMYTFLSLTPPIPSNPMAIAPVGIWYDLHVSANKIISKTIDQSVRQKDLVLYRRSAADDAQEALDAPDGHAVGIDDTEGIQTVSFGGQKNENVEMSQYLQSWFNTIAANPQGIGGQTLDSDSATEANILQSNADVTLNDMRDLVYLAAAEEGRKRAFYLHTDPLIDMPLARRRMEQTPNGPQPIREQVYLTPEVQKGEFLDFHFTVEPESMARMDSVTRLQRAMDFVGRVAPAAVQMGLMLLQMGQPFNLQTFMTRMAKEVGIDWFDEVWYDPTFQQRLQVFLMQSPAFAKGQAEGGGMQPNQAVPGAVKAPLGPQEQFNADQQMGAASMQSAMKQGFQGV